MKKFVYKALIILFVSSGIFMSTNVINAQAGQYSSSSNYGNNQINHHKHKHNKFHKHEHYHKRINNY
jgi:hypothetical protein